jgi:hypothetical protein
MKPYNVDLNNGLISRNLEIRENVNKSIDLVFGRPILIGLGAGYPCFVISIAMIGICTAVIGDVAGHLGCFIYLKDSVNAIAFVALGTSVPGKNNIEKAILETGERLNGVECLFEIFWERDLMIR